jgi:endonuclease/exonuclease/phosphatase family metal-dependent hydrolase
MSDQTRLFKILTLNLWHDNLPLANRERAQRHLIEGLSPDVIGFQEVLRDGNNCQARHLVSDLG